MSTRALAARREPASEGRAPARRTQSGQRAAAVISKEWSEERSVPLRKPGLTLSGLVAATGIFAGLSICLRRTSAAPPHPTTEAERSRSRTQCRLPCPGNSVSPSTEAERSRSRAQCRLPCPAFRGCLSMGLMGHAILFDCLKLII